MSLINAGNKKSIYILMLSIEAFLLMVTSANISLLTKALILFPFVILMVYKAKGSIDVCWNIAVFVITIFATALPCIRFFGVWINSNKVASISAHLGISIQMFLIICACFGAIMIFPSIYSFVYYCAYCIKNRTKESISKMLNLISALLFIVGVLMRGYFKNIELIYFSHAGGVAATIISLKYVVSNNKKNNTLLRYIGSSIWIMIFIYVIVELLGYENGSFGQYVRLCQLFYHILAPLVSIVSYIFFEEHILSYKYIVFPVSYVVLIGSLNVFVPLMLNVDVLYNSASTSTYGLNGVVLNLVFYIVFSIAISLCNILIFNIQNKKSFTRNQN